LLIPGSRQPHALHYQGGKLHGTGAALLLSVTASISKRISVDVVLRLLLRSSPRLLTCTP